MKVIIIGANHAGIAAANTILTNYKEAEVVIYDKNTNISFLGCGMALWIGEQIKKSDGLFYSSPEALKNAGAKVNMGATVIDVNFQKKELTIEKDGNKITDNYDKLILATGSRPRKGDAKNVDIDGVKYAKLYQDAVNVKEALKDDSIKDTVVIGTGYIGIELAEAVRRIGKNVTVISHGDRILHGYFDKEFSDKIKERMLDHGIKFQFNETVKEFKGDNKLEAVITDKGEYKAELAINSIGFIPNSELGGDKIERFKNGAYLVNKKFETSIKDVYAIGDAATEFNNATGETDYIALATNAVRSGVVAAHNACGREILSNGVQGSSAMQIYGYSLISTGLSKTRAESKGIEVLYTDFVDTQKPAFMEVNNPEVMIRIVYRKDNRKIIGAQLGSTYDVSAAIHLFSLAIEEGVTIDRLALTDLFFMPHFNQPYNYITMAALSAK